jgi:hypothetical protein
MTVLTGWAAAASAGAAPPDVVHTKVNVSLTDIDVCGFTVNSVVRGTDTFRTFADGTMQDTSHVVSTLTNVANGKVVHVENSGRDRFGGDPVTNPDGTVTFTDTLTGVPVRIYTSHKNTLVKDAGFLQLLDTFDADGDFVGQQVVEHGPHPFGGDQTVFCDAIAAAIG